MPVNLSLIICGGVGIVIVPAGRNIYSSSSPNKIFGSFESDDMSLSKEPTVSMDTRRYKHLAPTEPTIIAYESQGYCRKLFRPPITNHVRQHAIRAGHAATQLAIPNHAGVDVMPAPVIRHQQATF